MLEHTQRAHTSYFNKKINQMIIVINECMYEKDLRVLRFDLLEHLQTMIEKQEKQEKRMKVFTARTRHQLKNKKILSLHQLLENVIIIEQQEHGPLIRAADKLIE
jgi:hypothetical protein